MVLSLRYTGRSVTANIPALGAGDSGFESRRPDCSVRKKKAGCSIPVVRAHGVGADRVQFPAARSIISHFKNMNKSISSFVAIIMRRPWRSGLIGLVLLGTLAWFVIAQSNGNGDFESIKVTRKTLTESVKVSGKVQPAQEASLAFETSGTVSRIPAPIGTVVTQGDTIVALGSGELAAQYDAELIKLNELKNGTRPEELAISQRELESARATVAEKGLELSAALNDAYTRASNAIDTADRIMDNPNSQNATLSFSISDADLKIEIAFTRKTIFTALPVWRTLTLQASTTDSLTSAMTASLNTMSIVRNYLTLLSEALTDQPNDSTIKGLSVVTVRSDMANARTSLETAAASLSVARTAWQNARNALEVSERQLALKQSGSRSEVVAAQEAVVRQYEAKLAKTVLRAPFNGIVTAIDVELGELAPANQKVAGLMSANTFEVKAQVPEVEIAKIAVGNTATITLDAYGTGVSFPATVSEVEPAETVVGGVPTYTTTLTFTQEDPRIRSGMTANITITGAERPNTLAIPASALSLHDGNRIVKIPARNKDGFTERTVTTGIFGSDGSVEILSGLSEDETVLVPH